MWQAYPFAAGEVSCQKTALSFVDSLWEIFGPLLKGVPSLIVGDESLRDPERLVECLAAGRVSRLWLVPSLLRLLLDTFPDLPARLPDLTFWVTTGEAMTWELYRRFRQTMPQATLYNVYGTSEVWDATWYVPDTAHERLAHVPIGRPLANVACYILDEMLRPVPVGVTGELCVAGAGLGWGYLNRSGLTAERFVPNPFGGSDGQGPGSVLYRSGDRARYLPDGNIVFIGRHDHQLKLRGYRLEPGEIESCLNEHPAVKQAVVVVQERPGAEKRLVAFILARQSREAELEDGTLRRFLAEKVPEFMIPAVFSFLKEIPLTPSGKVNRAALPEPETGQARAATFLVDSVERELAQVWVGLLGWEKIGRDDNFFELGGHSMLAVRLFAQIEVLFGKKLPLATLFEAPTVGQLAAALRQAGYSPSWSSLILIRPGDEQPPFFFIHGVGGHVLRYYPLAKALPGGRPFYGLQSLGLDGRHQPLTTIEAMASHYLAEIQEVQPRGPYLLGGLSLGGFVALEMARQLHEQGEQVGLVALLDTNLSQAPRFRDALSWAAFLRFQLRLLVGKIRFHAHKFPAQLPERQRKTAGDQTDQSFEQLADEWGLRVSDSEPAMLEVMAANRTALFRYVPRRYPVKVVLFKSLHHGRGRYYGWQELASGGVEVHDIPGSHVTIIKEPNVQLLAQRLEACIRQVLGDGA
jgi:thioesterase domain-containing protein/acyl carrier protein